MCIISQHLTWQDRAVVVVVGWDGAGQKSYGRQDTVRYHDEGEDKDLSVALLKTHVHTLKADGQMDSLWCLNAAQVSTTNIVESNKQ